MGKTLMPDAPVPLTPDHEAAGFFCGISSLDVWLKTRALKNQRTGASRTYVVCEGARIVAYYALVRAEFTGGIGAPRFLAWRLKCLSQRNGGQAGRCECILEESYCGNLD